MLKTITIQNLVIIDQVEIDFKSGLNVLTGETGAGKSILLQAIMMVLGEKIESRIIQAGKDACHVTAEFSLARLSPTLHQLAEAHEFPIDANDKLLRIRRTLKKDGKSKCWINDVAIGVTILQQLAPELVEIEAQGQSHRLTHVDNHRDLLDSYGKHAPLLEALAADYKHYQDLLAQKVELEKEIKKLADDRDYWLAAKKELEGLKIVSGESQELEEKRKKLLSAEKTIASLQEILEKFNDRNGIMADSMKVSKLLTRLATDRKNLVSAGEAMDNAMTNLQLVQEGLEKELDEVANPDWSLQDIEERLFALKDAGRKYRQPIDELGDYLEKINQRLTSATNQEKNLNQLTATIKEAEKKYHETAADLTTARKKSADNLTKQVMAVLPDLKLPHASFHIEFLSSDTPSAKGMEKIQFLCQTNPGQNKDLLHKIASGGELARFLLAIEQAIGAGVDCLVFDEVDSGVGGATADAVGKLLLKLSAHQQCFVITHSPQVAAIGKHHFRVEKVIDKNKTTSSVKKLTTSERVAEIARMLSAENVTAEAEAQAKKLLGYK